MQREKVWVCIGLLTVGAALLGRSIQPILTPPGVSPLASAAVEHSLKAGFSIERELRGGESHAYRVHLKRGDFLHIVAVQKGVDVAVTFFDPKQRPRIYVDSPNGPKGPEVLFAVADVSGDYRVLITALKQGESGRYSLRMDPPRAASRDDRIQAAAAERFAVGEEMRNLRSQRGKRAAILAYEDVLRLLSGAPDTGQQSVALHRLGWMHWDLGEGEKALSCYEQALRFRIDPVEKLVLLNRLATAYEAKGETDRALAINRSVVDLAHQIHESVVEAGARENIGLIQQRRGEIQAALESYQRALALLQDQGPHQEQVAYRASLADLYLDLGRPRRVLDLCLQVLDNRSGTGDLQGEAACLEASGSAYAHLGLTGLAVRILGESLDVARQSGSDKFQVKALNALAAVYLESDQPGPALDFLREAREITVRDGDILGEANTLANLARAEDLQGHGELAVELFTKAEEVYRRFGDRMAVAKILNGRALAARSSGHFPEARRDAEESLKLIEALRREPERAELRASLLDARRSVYELYVDLLARLHEQEPGAGYDARAFEASEGTRARTFFEELSDVRPALADKDLDALRLRKDEVERKLQAKSLERDRLWWSPKAVRPRIAELDEEIRDLIARYESLSYSSGKGAEAQAQKASSGLPSLSEVQSLLDTGTSILVYSLGQARSFLWWIDRDAITLKELPSRDKIEPLARSAYEAMADGSKRARRAELDAALGKLSQVLLAPVAGRLRHQKLVVVADGVLQYVPFAALPNPRTGEPLVTKHALVSLPSAACGVLLHNRGQRRQPPARWVAVLADPVFSSKDERVRSKLFGNRVTSAALEDLRGVILRPGLGDFKRLPFTSQEADSILRLVPAGQGFEALGFAASRQMATSPELAQYRYLHFATHGWIDSRHPELSGLVFSLVDSRGRLRDGILHSYQLAGLRLPVELVTLSACKTALGSKVAGEALSGLTRGFMEAGAQRVLVSLWNVNDRATSILMASFYRGLLKEGKSPAEALRAAQVEMLSDPDRRSPFYWAGFVLQGDWR